MTTKPFSVTLVHPDHDRTYTATSRAEATQLESAGWTTADGAQPSTAPSEIQQPANSAPKAEWVAYAAAAGMDEAEAADLTKTDLIAALTDEPGIEASTPQ